jgi:vitamin B12 transporter
MFLRASSSPRTGRPRRWHSHLVVFASAAFAMSPAVAQTQWLTPVVVTGSREPLPLDRLVGDVVVIDSERIRATLADSLETLLSREGGIQLSRNGGPGQGAAVLMRGSGGGNTVVLIDGVRIGSATLGQVDLSALSLAQIERIEILRGPGSSLYGADAVGGVVRIVTRRGAGESGMAAHLAMGGRQASEAALQVAGAGGGFDATASISREADRGSSAVAPNDRFGLYNPDRDGFSRHAAQAQFGFAPVGGHRIGATLLSQRVRAQYDGVEYPPPDFAPDASGDFVGRLGSELAALDYRGNWSPQWATSVQWSAQRESLRTGANVIERYDTRRHQFVAQVAWAPSASQQWVVAVEQLTEAAEASSLPSVGERRTTGWVIGYTGRLGAHKLQADLRRDANSVYGRIDTGKLGWGVDVAPGWTLRTVAGTAFRAPSFNELYYPGYGVPDVRPERSRSIETGLQWHAGASSAAATLYHNRVGDLIGYEGDRRLCPADPSYDFGCARNLARARLQGATVTAAHRLAGIELRCSIDFLDARDSATGKRLTRRAAHQESLSADWMHGPWALGAALQSVGARPEGGTLLEAYRTLDLKAFWRVAAAWRLESRLLNATGRAYQNALDYPGPGRQAWLGLRYDGAAR